MTWAPVMEPGYEGLYEVSTSGVVRSTRSGEELKGWVQNGYLMVHLSNMKEGIDKSVLVHRLVAIAHLPNAEDLPCVNHKDENRLNNNLENLEWCDQTYNNAYGTRNERIRKTCKEMGLTGTYPSCRPVKCLETNIVYPSVTIASMATGTNRRSISEVLHGRSKTAGGYHWG